MSLQNHDPSDLPPTQILNVFFFLWLHVVLAPYVSEEKLQQLVLWIFYLLSTVINVITLDDPDYYDFLEVMEELSYKVYSL